MNPSSPDNVNPNNANPDNANPDTANESWFSRWRRCRDHDSDSPLDVLLGTDVAMRPGELVDVACLDLMQQRRNGRPACVEDYVRSYPVLDHESHRLDLIDAEICICNELRCPQTLQQWQDRFPNDQDAIGSLWKMDAGPANEKSQTGDERIANATVISQSAIRGELSEEDDFSIDASELTAIAVSDAGLCDAAIGNAAYHAARPIDPSATPDWFVGQKVFASGPGWWIMRGVHRDTHATYALKIMELPATISPSQIQRLSEVVSRCSQSTHPNWVGAESSTVYNGHLGVLRPWVHGVAWRDQTGDVPTIVRRLASVAMMLASTSAAGRQHGGVHAGNLWIDHQGQLKLMDAGSSRRGIRQWLTGGPGEFMSEQQRTQLDCEEFKALIAATLMRSSETLADTILQGIRDPELTPLQLGEFLLDAADGKPPRKNLDGSNLGSRLTQFLFGGNERRP